MSDEITNKVEQILQNQEANKAAYEKLEAGVVTKEAHAAEVKDLNEKFEKLTQELQDSEKRAAELRAVSDAEYSAKTDATLSHAPNERTDAFCERAPCLSSSLTTCPTTKHMKRLSAWALARRGLSSIANLRLTTRKCFTLCRRFAKRWTVAPMRVVRLLCPNPNVK